MSAQLEHAAPDAPVGVTDQLNEATRWMCSRALADRVAAKRIFDRYCVPHAGAIAPSPGIDMPALARHAAWAVDDDREACGALTLLWLGVAVAAGAAAFLGVNGGTWWPPLVAAGVFALLAIVFMSGRMASRHARARQVMGASTGHVERIGEDFLPEEQRRRLDEATDGNLVVYEESGALDDPAYLIFPGFGDVAGRTVQLPVDVSRPIDGAELGHVEPYDLLRHLERAVPKHDPSGTTDDHLSSLMAHVRGSEVANDSSLRVDGGDRVVAVAPGSYVRAAAEHPTRHVRTYARTMAIGHSGHLVTTLHVSAVVTMTGLSLNLVVHMLRPLRGEWAVAGGVPATGRGRRWRALRTAAFWRLLVVAPDEWWRLRRMVRQARRDPQVARGPLGRRRSKGAYGATFGLRHLASRGSSLTYNESVDLQRQATDLVQRAFTETASYLEARGIDPSSLRPRVADAVREATAYLADGTLGRKFDALAVDDDIDPPPGD